ncbi:dolichyl-diphosphooligosaccharide-protein glycosyltransferase subunit DAD1, putative (macronuclear) [Tetrahymena thermophila SB210]|uniref:Dolichyl-diphosphooligosaccharide--protein glycosyltransferase subunit OST2 n=1 Tax=Tetrahymena thermophila (strain SB210) TaxID=312017 RepID=I7M930_TETTS|nr:dolichyl-diphosphooligosaccharide-protein glycosyltransferase subunit DAD1, putative [Tetrahymena thermophila SB210]EAS00602.1 dolichyl-diphosphooligosaccharide-protein glycosyltransferase subunit DAD1, putative [Tetrahymena thermophila SB210]|eukprot:XP_001020847.1 dolichyl-diphosphooligosaccharide-protein glycosyltransferase subunit DAD1, putative [Tetrahymena thermophila SB210]
MSKKVQTKKKQQTDNSSDSDSEDDQLEMKQINLSSVRDIFRTFWNSYKKNTPSKIKLMDAFVVYCIMIICIQFFYYFVVGNFPQNSLIIGIFAPLGSATFTVCLRQQISQKTRYMNQSSDRSFWEYFLSMYIMFLACINYLG